MIQMLRRERNSGQMHDLAHVRSEDCLADSLTKHSAKADELKHSKEKYTFSETKKRRRSTDQDEVEEENREPSGERSVKPKVTMEYRNSENLDEFIQELKETYLEIEMSKKDAEEELVETKRNFLRFMEKYNKDPRRAHPKLTECERASLAHVDPDVNLRRRVLLPPSRGMSHHGRVQECTANIRISY